MNRKKYGEVANKLFSFCVSLLGGYVSFSRLCL